MSVFLENPAQRFGWKELSKKARLGPPSTKRYIDELEKEGIITVKKMAGRKFYLANRESRLYRLYKKLDTVLKLEKSGIIDFLNKEYGYPAIILFGSHSSGEAVEDSDIDIAVFTETKKSVDIKIFEKVLGKEVHLFRFSKIDIRKMRRENKSMYNGLFNGHVISGFAEVD